MGSSVLDEAHLASGLGSRGQRFTVSESIARSIEHPPEPMQVTSNNFQPYEDVCNMVAEWFPAEQQLAQGASDLLEEQNALLRNDEGRRHVVEQPTPNALLGASSAGIQHTAQEPVVIDDSRSVEEASRRDEERLRRVGELLAVMQEEERTLLQRESDRDDRIFNQVAEWMAFQADPFAHVTTHNPLDDNSLREEETRLRDEQRLRDVTEQMRALQEEEREIHRRQIVHQTLRMFRSYVRRQARQQAARRLIRSLQAEESDAQASAATAQRELFVEECAVCMDNEIANPRACVHCRTLAGCEVCVLQWYRSQLERGQRTTCPRCRAPWSVTGPRDFVPMTELPPRPAIPSPEAAAPAPPPSLENDSDGENEDME